MQGSAEAMRGQGDWEGAGCGSGVWRTWQAWEEIGGCPCAQPQTMTAMAPYLALTQAVRRGDLKDFQRVAEQHAAAFATDGTANLIVRLRNNVIRAGLRRISLAYSRISLADVASRLGLEGSQRDIECVVAKAIRDGAVDVTLDHEAGCLVSNEVLDIYSSYEPQVSVGAASGGLLASLGGRRSRDAAVRFLPLMGCHCVTAARFPCPRGLLPRHPQRRHACDAVRAGEEAGPGKARLDDGRGARGGDGGGGGRVLSCSWRGPA